MKLLIWLFFCIHNIIGRQSKWVAEQLCMEARTRGVPVSIYRFGTISGTIIIKIRIMFEWPLKIIIGDSTTGISHTSDFINRLVSWLCLFFYYYYNLNKLDSWISIYENMSHCECQNWNYSCWLCFTSMYLYKVLLLLLIIIFVIN